jgi:hypothetical protein
MSAASSGAVRFAYTGDPILRPTDLVFEWRPAGTDGAWERDCWEIAAEHLAAPVDWRVRLAFTGEVLEQRSAWRPPQHSTSVSIDLRGKVHAHHVETTDDQGARFAADVWPFDVANPPDIDDRRKSSWTGSVCIVSAGNEFDVVIGGVWPASRPSSCAVAGP